MLPVDLKKAMKELELKSVLEAINETRGNVAAAARLLGIQRTTLVMKLKKFRIDKAAFYPNLR